MRWVTLFGLLACGGPVPQSAICAAYVSCVEARDAELGIATNLDRFQEGGDCWGGAEIAELCDRGCEGGLDWMRSSYTDLPEACQP